VIIPVAIERAIVNGEMLFDHVSMSDPQGYSIILSANGTIANVNTLGLSGAILPAVLSVQYHGDTIGTIPTTKIEIGPNQLGFQLSARMNVDGTLIHLCLCHCSLYELIRSLHLVWL
jgi:hypothetical protein